MPSPISKIHQIHYVPKNHVTDGVDDISILALSTEDSRVLFFDTQNSELSGDGIPNARLVAELSTESINGGSRIKDFCVLQTSSDTKLLVTGSSDGKITVWRLDSGEFDGKASTKNVTCSENAEHDAGEPLSEENDDSIPSRGEDSHNQPKRVGTLLGHYEIGNRITCLTAFLLESNDNENHQSLTNKSIAGYD